MVVVVGVVSASPGSNVVVVVGVVSASGSNVVVVVGVVSALVSDAVGSALIPPNCWLKSLPPARTTRDSSLISPKAPLLSLVPPSRITWSVSCSIGWAGISGVG